MNFAVFFPVRSLGSVAITKAEESDYHFNYFSVDLNGEKNALYGGFLLEQTGTLVSFLIYWKDTFYSFILIFSQFYNRSFEVGVQTQHNCFI